jgi:putative ABC transport system permease protein
MRWRIEAKGQGGRRVGAWARSGTAIAMTVAIVASVAGLFFMPGWLFVVCLTLAVAWMAFTETGHQTWSVAWLGMATIPQRAGACAVVVVGIAAVVGVFVALLAMGAGFEATLTQTGTDDTAIVMQTEARSEVSSTISPETVGIITQASQVAKSSEGRPIASPELLVVASLKERDSGRPANVQIRGVGRAVWDLRPKIKIAAGRKLKRGLNELVIGRDIRQRFAGANIGEKMTLNGQSWAVVGVFDSGDAHNSEVWGDTDVVGSAFHRDVRKTSLAVRLTNARAFNDFRAELENDPRLKVSAQTTRQYYSRQSEGLSRAAGTLAMAVATIMAVGAAVGALNTMYSAVDARAREIATFRALGFHRTAVVVAVLLETMLLAVTGGLIGAAIAWLVFDGFTASTLGANGQIIFDFDVSPALLWKGLQWALAIGCVGGLFPALRAALRPIALGLRKA